MSNRPAGKQNRPKSRPSNGRPRPPQNAANRASGSGGTKAATSARDRYGAPTSRRTALAPGLLAAIVLIAGFALIGNGGYLFIEYAVAILALIVAWFAFQAKQWWWIPLLLAIAVIWNPVFPFGFDGPYWFGAQYVAILVFVLVAIFVKVPIADAQKPGRVR